MTTPKFDNPPVVELVFAVLFNLGRPLKTADVGLYWNKIQHKFPDNYDAPPVPAQVEVPLSSAPNFNFEFTTQQPLPRNMFFNEAKTRLVQIQADRFIFNWKRASLDDPYPSYEVVSKEFFSEFLNFKSFLSAQNLVPLTIRQFELGYVNLISEESGLKMVTKTQALVDHIRNSDKNRFLPEPAFFSWNTSYDLPDDFGRLHVSAYTAFLPPNPNLILRLDLTARGILPNPDTGMETWFKLAHEWVTCGFADSTSQLLHEKIWKRRQPPTTP